MIAGLSTPAQFNTYAPIFQAATESFKPLTDAKKINKKPERVRIKNLQKI